MFKIEMLHVYGDTKPTTRCGPADLDKCTPKELAYIQKLEARHLADGALRAEHDRLVTLEDNGHFTHQDLDWLHIRQTILVKMIQHHVTDEL